MLTEETTLEQHWLRIMGPMECFIPILNAAMEYTPTSFVDSSTEVLTKHGRSFVRLLYSITSEALYHADRGWSAVPTPDEEHEAFVDGARQVDRHLATCVLVCRALMEPDLPEEVSGHEGLEKVLEEAEAALSILEGIEPGRTLGAARAEGVVS